MEEKSMFDDDNQPIVQTHHDPYSQSTLLNDYVFQQTLAVHQGSVRTVATLDNGYMLSGSIDTSTKLFMLDNSNGKYQMEKEMKYHSGFIYSIAPSILQDGFFTGSNDTKIFKVDLLGNPVMQYEGHEGAVNSLSQSIPEEFVSGSWDGTAKIWDVETGKEKQTLPGHSHATAVLSLANGIVITGSQDKKIRIWYNGNMERELDAHDDIIRQFCEVPGIGFASCSNDETVKLWSIDGMNLAELRGHSGYVFSVAMLDSGELLSASDDRTVKVWRDQQCVQTIEHPRTVWSVTKNHLGDIVTGGEDYKIRTFTRDHTRKGEGEGLREYEDECKATAMGDQIDMDTLPTLQKMQTTKGKEGEIKVFKNGTQAEAYCWKAGKWEKIGDVISAPGGGTAKQYEGDRIFEAGEYDHIFDVDLGDNILRKLPFDNGSNPLVAADKFVIREGLHKAYCEQISAFIKQNSSSFVTSDLAEKKAGNKSQQPGDQSASKKVVETKIEGMKTLLFFDQINVENPKKKLLEFNSELGILSDNELQTLESFLELIKNKPMYHSSKASKQGHELVKKLFRFPADKALPALDIYRMFLMHPSSSESYKLFETGIECLSTLISFIKDGHSPQPTQLIGLRCVTNLFNNSASVYLMLQRRQFVLDNLCQFVFSDNKNIRNAIITIMLNYSIFFLDKNDPEGRIQIVSALAEALPKENDEQNALRIKTTLKNLSIGDEDAKDFIQSMGVNLNSL